MTTTNQSSFRELCTYGVKEILALMIGMADPNIISIEYDYEVFPPYFCRTRKEYNLSFAQEKDLHTAFNVLQELILKEKLIPLNINYISDKLKSLKHYYFVTCDEPIPLSLQDSSRKEILAFLRLHEILLHGTFAFNDISSAFKNNGVDGIFAYGIKQDKIIDKFFNPNSAEPEIEITTATPIDSTPKLRFDFR